MSTAVEDAPASGVGDTRFSALLSLVGEPFLFASTSYPDVLVLHFGERRADPPRVIKGREYRHESGTYSLSVSASEWVVKRGDVAVTNRDHDATPPFDDLRATAEAALAPGSRVLAAVPFPVDHPDVVGYGLRVEFSNGAAVTVVPTPDDDPHAAAPDGTPFAPLADWKLRTPRVELAVFPGREIRVVQRGA